MLQHKNKDVNFKVWKEAQAYGDIQLMPFVDYYNLLTYKTVAICIMGVHESHVFIRTRKLKRTNSIRITIFAVLFSETD